MRDADRDGPDGPRDGSFRVGRRNVQSASDRQSDRDATDGTDGSVDVILGDGAVSDAQERRGGEVQARLRARQGASTGSAPSDALK